MLKCYGEERYARRIARRIVQQRRQAAITTTTQLAEVVAAANPAWQPGKHPATRVFQAVRIHLNNELVELEQGLSQALTVLASGGRLVVISFHSLEHRLVKQFFATQTQGDHYPRLLPVPQVYVAASPESHRQTAASQCRRSSSQPARSQCGVAGGREAVTLGLSGLTRATRPGCSVTRVEKLSRRDPMTAKLLVVNQ